MDASALKLIVIIGVLMLLVDMVWLTIRQPYHAALFSAVQKSPLTMRLAPAIGVYVLLPVIVYLAAVKDASSAHNAAVRGAITGFLLYGFYDLTNYATLTGWTLHMTLTDTLWGTFVCAVGAAAGYYFAKLI
jgi:uncharacterized membrane protein